MVYVTYYLAIGLLFLLICILDAQVSKRRTNVESEWIGIIVVLVIIFGWPLLALLWAAQLCGMTED